MATMSLRKRRDRHGNYIYTIAVPLGRQPDGKYGRHKEEYHSAKLLSDREKNRIKTYREREVLAARARPVAATMTLHEWASRWITAKKEQVAGFTAYNYASQFTNRILPDLGHLALAELDEEEIVRWQTGLIDAKRLDHRPGVISSHLRKKLLILLSSCLQAAVQKQLIPQNPAAHLARPVVKRHEMAIYTAEQLTALFAALQHEPLRFRAQILLLVTLGIRRGELIALKWSDLDESRQTLTIDEGSELVPHQPQRACNPKTARSRRILPIPALIIDILQSWRTEQAAQRAAWHQEHEQRQPTNKRRPQPTWDAEHIFTSINGNWFRGEILTHEFANFLTRHHLPRLRLHDLRHTAISHLLSIMDILTVSRFAGHSSPTITLGIYGHTLDPQFRTAGDHLANLLQAPPNSPPK